MTSQMYIACSHMRNLVWKGTSIFVCHTSLYIAHLRASPAMGGVAIHGGVGRNGGGRHQGAHIE